MASANEHWKADWGGGPAGARDGGSAKPGEDRPVDNQVPHPVSPHDPEPRPGPPFSTIIGPKGQIGVTAEGGGLNNWIKTANRVHEKYEFVMEPLPKRKPGRPPGKSGKKPPPKVKGLMLDLRRKLGEALAKDPAPGNLLALTKCVVLLAQLEGAKLASKADIRTGAPPVVKKRRGRAKPNLAPSFEDELDDGLEDD